MLDFFKKILLCIKIIKKVFKGEIKDVEMN